MDDKEKRVETRGKILNLNIMMFLTTITEYPVKNNK